MRLVKYILTHTSSDQIAVYVDIYIESSMCGNIQLSEKIKVQKKCIR